MSPELIFSKVHSPLGHPEVKYVSPAAPGGGSHYNREVPQRPPAQVSLFGLPTPKKGGRGHLKKAACADLRLYGDRRIRRFFKRVERFETFG